MSGTVEYGIDLGTTNSCIARWESGSVRVFQNNDLMNVTPSAVHILKTGRVIAGRRARAALLTDRGNVEIEFKRRMGQKYAKTFPASGITYTAEELSAEILKALREDVRRQTGVEASTAVITVPAAFKALQCEATARAATIAGFFEAPLLQEPIAAAMGYGIKPEASDQRWLVFDLGGGTLDIAVISTREGRLTVLNHLGDHLLGGKDVDRLIVERIVLPAVEEEYDLGDTGPASARATLLPRLHILSEEAKIDLSSDTQVVISLFDLGEDDAGNPIEMDVPFTRVELEGLMEPIVDRCCSQAAKALEGARLTGADLDRVLLVGGPTQSPFLRAALQNSIEAPIDLSVDPMTVVACGAAVYASTLETSQRWDSAPAADAVKLKLAFDPVCVAAECEVHGRLVDQQADIEVKIEADGGFWTSGWMKPGDEGLFVVSAPLREADTTTFWVYARNSRGQLLETDIPDFVVRHGLIPTAPPLPHTLSVEVLGAGGQAELDPVFSKGVQLPAETTVRYRAAHPLVPGDPSSDLAIKLWEGEYLEVPDANEWVGCVILANDHISRTVPEGAEIEITITVTASRLIEVEAFVPHLNQGITGSLFVGEQQDYGELSSDVEEEVEDYRRRLVDLEDQLEVVDDDSLHQALDELRGSLEELEGNLDEAMELSEELDPDDARRAVERARAIRGDLGRLERAWQEHTESNETALSTEETEAARGVVEKYGTAFDKQQFAKLSRKLEQAAAVGDKAAFVAISKEMNALRWRVLSDQDWFWRDIFEDLSSPGVYFVDRDEAQRLIAEGREANTTGDGQRLRTTVRALWRLQPDEDVDEARDRVMRSGLRRF
ncbi:MAG: Hsp70 family protein [Myxococcota bacterium]|jgi:molecular chaperone DnaK|nr:Hsp70 family protein [Myxococcota bacterium]